MTRNLVMNSSKRGKPLKDPHGGLTAAGRRYFARTEGAHLRPGVMKAEKDMTAEDMKRKGSFLRRHYGRKNPFKLVDAKGQPTRYALQAQAWGERLPKTQEDIERLAAKGQKLLAKAERLRHRAQAKSPSRSKAPTTSRSASRRS